MLGSHQPWTGRGERRGSASAFFGGDGPPQSKKRGEGQRISRQIFASKARALGRFGDHAGTGMFAPGAWWWATRVGQSSGAGAQPAKGRSGRSGHFLVLSAVDRKTSKGWEARGSRGKKRCDHGPAGPIGSSCIPVESLLGAASNGGVEAASRRSGLPSLTRVSRHRRLLQLPISRGVAVSVLFRLVIQ